MNKIFNLKKKYFNGGVQNKKGFVKIVLLVIGALILLKYVYDIDIVGFLTQGRFKELWDKLYNLGLKGWESYKDIITNIFERLKNLF